MFLFHQTHQYLPRLFCAQLPFLGFTVEPILSKLREAEVALSRGQTVKESGCGHC